MDKVADKALGLLEQLARQVGTTVERLFPYLVRQAFIESMVYIVLVPLAGLLMLAGGVVWVHRGARIEKEESRDEAGPYFAAGIIAMILGAIFVFSGIGVNLPGLLNPEYYAIQELLRLVRPK